VVLNTVPTMAAKISQPERMPSVRIFVNSVQELPNKVMILTPDGTQIEKRVKFSGLAGQCFLL
jgi:hypothetical protein